MPATPPTIIINDGDDGVAIAVADDDDVAAPDDDDDDVITVANDDDEADAVGVVPTTPPTINTFDYDATIVTPANPIPTLGESNTNQKITAIKRALIPTALRSNALPQPPSFHLQNLFQNAIDRDTTATCY